MRQQIEPVVSLDRGPQAVAQGTGLQNQTIRLQNQYPIAKCATQITHRGPLPNGPEAPRNRAEDAAALAPGEQQAPFLDDQARTPRDADA